MDVFELIQNLEELPYDQIKDIVREVPEKKLRKERIEYKKAAPEDIRLRQITDTVDRVIISGLSRERLIQRMWLNWDYNPSEIGYEEWNSKCHPKYALMGDDAKYRLMLKTASVYKFKVRDSGRSRINVKSAVKWADRAYARYADWCLAQVEKYGVGLDSVVLTGKSAFMDYVFWAKRGMRVSERTRILLTNH